MRRWLTRLAVLVAPAAVVPLFALPASPAFAAAPVDYVALGDSYSSGVGAPPYDPASGSCLRSPRGYPQLWATSHTVSSFQFVACGGATTDDVLGSQVAALNANTDLVSITIGGNDVGFASTLSSCVLGSDSACVNAVNAGRTAATTTLPARLDNTYAAIRARAPNARVVVLGYPRLISPTGSCGLFNLSTVKRTALNEGADVLAGVIAGRASAAGFVHVDARARFEGHGACGSSPWINRFNLLSVTESFHPNATGYAQGYLPLLNGVTG